MFQRQYRWSDDASGGTTARAPESAASSNAPPRTAKGMGTAHDLTHVDIDAFAKELAALGRRLRKDIGDDDLAHLRKMQRAVRIATAVGFSTAWLGPNPVSAVSLGWANYMRWMIAHHVIHGGYDKFKDRDPRLHGKTYARGRRRFADWLDWMSPDAWHIEHNRMHHYRLGEHADPDLPEENNQGIRNSNLPRWARRAAILAVSTVWKPVYYAPAVMNQLMNHQATRKGEPAPRPQRMAVYEMDRELLWATLRDCWAPYGLWRFVALPAMYSPLGPLAVASAASNLVLAEAVANAWSFWTIVPNHTGDDVMRFDVKTESKAEFYVRQVVGSVDFRCGGDLNDMLHGFMNYQVEHHLFPDLTMLKYQEAHAQVKAVCERHGVPFVQDNLVVRFWKTLDVLTGETSMPVVATATAQS